jgi:hypothetical protein
VVSDLDSMRRLEVRYCHGNIQSSPNRRSGNHIVCDTRVEDVEVDSRVGCSVELSSVSAVGTASTGIDGLGAGDSEVDALFVQSVLEK